MLKDIDDKCIADMNQQLFLRMGLEFYQGKELDESLKWLDKVLEAGGNSSYAEAKANYYKAVVGEEKGTEFEVYISRAVEILKNIKSKSREELYLLASIYKESADIKAKECFFALVDAFPVDNLTGGAYFHLGEIAFADKDYTESEKCFKRCLSIISNHVKAKKYLDRIRDIEHG